MVNIKKIIREEVNPRAFGKKVATIMIGDEFVNLHNPPNKHTIDRIESEGANFFGMYKTTEIEIVRQILEDWREAYNKECAHCPWPGWFDDLGFDPNDAEVVEYYEGYIPYEEGNLSKIFESTDDDLDWVRELNAVPQEGQIFATKHNFFKGRPTHPFIIVQSDNDGIKYVSLEQAYDYEIDDQGKRKMVGTWGANPKRKEQRINEPHKVTPKQAVHNIKSGWWVEIEIGEDNKLYKKDVSITESEEFDWIRDIPVNPLNPGTIIFIDGSENGHYNNRREFFIVIELTDVNGDLVVYQKLDGTTGADSGHTEIENAEKLIKSGYWRVLNLSPQQVSYLKKQRRLRATRKLAIKTPQFYKRYLIS